MRLDKLRGFGPWLAYASPASLALAVVSWLSAIFTLSPPSPPPPTFYALAVLALVLLGAWMVTLLAVAVDLEWIEHPLTHTGLTYVALGAAAVAALAFIVVLVTPLMSLPDWLMIAIAFLWQAGVGVYLVIINLVGRRAGVIRHGLAWVGVVAGAFDLIAALLVAAGLPQAIALPMLPAILLYVIWSIWLGFQLRRKLPTPAAAPA